jgi:hypothetical protein
MNGTDDGDRARFEEAVRELEGTVVRKVDADMRAYGGRRSGARNLAASVAATTILLSALLPLLAAFDYNGKELVLSLVGVTIAAVTGLGSYFHWGDLWKGYLIAWNDIQNARAHWDLDVVAARREETEEAALEAAYRAADRLLEATRSAIDREHGTYFAMFGKPSSSG